MNLTNPHSQNTSAGTGTHESQVAEVLGFERFIEDVEHDNITVSSLVKKAVKRHVNDLAKARDRGFWFDRAAAQHYCDIFPKIFRHSKGPFAGRPLDLSPWQHFIIAMLFGWKCIDPSPISGKYLRRFKRAYIEVARKNGKSTLMAGIALLMLVADGEAGARVYLAATSLKQTKEVWEPAVQMVNSSRILQQEIKVLHDRLVFSKTDSVMQPVCSDTKSLDGLNVSCAILDELHAHPTPKIWEVLDSATGAREQPLIVIITTAGTNQSGVCFERHNYVRSILSGTIEDDGWFGFIAAIDDGDTWDDEQVWEKANPNLKYIPTILPDLRSKVPAARNDPANRANFFIKHLCRWTSSSMSWLKVEDWDRCPATFEYDKLAGNARPAFASFDLAENLDLTACCLCIPPLEASENWRYTWRFFLPEDTYERYKDEKKYPWLRWKQSGELILTPGAITDQSKVFDTIMQWAKDFDLQLCGFDPWHGQSLAATLQNEGIEIVKLAQNISTLSEGSKTFAAQLQTAQIEHDAGNLMRWQIDNVALKTDGQGNGFPSRPQKNLNDRKVDGVVAAVMACALAVRRPIEVYEPLPLPIQI